MTLRTQRPAVFLSSALVLAFTLGGCESPPKYGPGEYADYPIKGEVIQSLRSFDNPEGAVLGLDGRHVYISSAAEHGNKDKGFAFTTGGAYISKLQMLPDGTLKMVKLKLVRDLTGTLGMAVLPVKTGKFPKGTVFVCQGNSLKADANGDWVSDPAKLEPSLVGFSPDGQVLGSLKLTADSAFAKASGGTPLFPNAAAFDGDGNLYFSDSGNGGDRIKPAVKPNPGVYMVPYSSLDALADGADPPKPIRFIAVPDGPNGVTMGPDWAVHVSTLGKTEDVGGALYAIPRDNFKTGKLPEPFQKNLGKLDGIAFVGRTRIDTAIGKVKRIYVTPPAARSTQLVLMPETKLAGPADPALGRAEDGSHILIVPDPHWMSSPAGGNPVLVIQLPLNFEGR